MISSEIAVHPSFEKFEIEGNWCQLKPGDDVVPQTVVGRDYDSGEVVRAGFHGYVAASYFNPMNHSLIVIIIHNRHRGEPVVAVSV